MFVFEADSHFPDLLGKARRALGTDALITYLAPIKTRHDLFDFLCKFNYDTHATGLEIPDIKIIKIEFQYSVEEFGYREKVTVFKGTYQDRPISGCLIKHTHENGCLQYFLSYSC